MLTLLFFLATMYFTAKTKGEVQELACAIIIMVFLDLATLTALTLILRGS